MRVIREHCMVSCMEDSLAEASGRYGPSHWHEAWEPCTETLQASMVPVPPYTYVMSGANEPPDSFFEARW